MVLRVRRRISIFALCFAWLCANGALWDVVQVVGWAKMIHDYSQVMPVAKALEITFDGSAPCGLCEISQAAQDAAREPTPLDRALGGCPEKFLMIAESVPAVILSAPDFVWPGVANGTGLTRPTAVPLTPPRV